MNSRRFFTTVNPSQPPFKKGGVLRWEYHPTSCTPYFILGAASERRTAFDPKHFPLFKGGGAGVSSGMPLACGTAAQCSGLRVLQGLREIFSRHGFIAAQNPPHPCRARILLHQNAVQQARPMGRETPASPSFKKGEVFRKKLSAFDISNFN